MKYFFLSESWTTGRVWEFGGLWNELAWKRKPHLRKRSLCIKEHGETLCLYEAEESILMVEVMPKAITPNTRNPAIGQVVLKRLLSAEQAIERLCQEDDIFQHPTGRNHNASQTAAEQRVETATTNTISTDRLHVDHGANQLSSDDHQQIHATTETNETSPALQTQTTKTSHINPEPVAINEYEDQG